MRRTPGTFAILLFVCGLSAPPALAQFLSAIEGTVVDNTGAAVPGAKVVITDTQLGVSRTDTTNQSGFLSIGSIAASTYTIQI
jgi:hypothetical protein